MLKRLFLIGTALVGMTALARADQGQFQYPQVGQPANTICVTFINGVCSQYQPAGPTSLTGQETIPADSNAVQGQPPQTIEIQATLLGAGAAIYASPLTGTTVTATSSTGKIVLTPAATIAALTIQLPPVGTYPNALVDGQVLDVGSSQTVTTLTVTAGAGTTVVSAPTTIAANGSFRLIYRASNTSWYLF